MLFWDDALTPAVALLDPEMTVQTGAFLTAASGMTAVARCVEALYSADRNALSEGLALHALRLLSRSLPVTVENPTDLAARADCQIACAMSGIASMNAMVSLVHALGHIFGGRYALQHGVSHTILLPSAMRSLLPVIGERQKLVLEAMGGTPRHSADAAGAAAADLLDAMIARLPLKRRLRDIGVAAEDLPKIAAASTSDYMMANLPVPMSVTEIEAALRAAW
jgi:alcohol dehydrogenase class IV